MGYTDMWVARVIVSITLARVRFTPPPLPPLTRPNLNSPHCYTYANDVRLLFKIV